MEHVRHLVQFFLNILPCHRCIVQALAKGAQCAQQTNTRSAAFNNSLAEIPSELRALFGPLVSPGQEDCMHNLFTSLRRLYISLYRSDSRYHRSAWDYRFFKIACPLGMPPTFAAIFMTNLQHKVDLRRWI